MKNSMTEQELRYQIEATLDRLNAHGVIASVSDAQLALARAREAKVRDSFASLFGTLGVADLVTAQRALDALQPKPVAAKPSPPATIPKGSKRK